MEVYQSILDAKLGNDQDAWLFVWRFGFDIPMDTSEVYLCVESWREGFSALSGDWFRVILCAANTFVFVKLGFNSSFQMTKRLHEYTELHCLQK